MKQVAVFGDTGGHYTVLMKALKQLDVNLETYIIPENLQIIHLGDLIHKGPDSEKLVRMVNKLIKNNPGQWIQIFGNHEFSHFPATVKFWKCSCSPKLVETLHKWFNNGDAFIAYGLDNIKPPHLEVSKRHTMQTDSNSWMFVHGGITFEFWRALGSPISAVDTATKINNLPLEATNQTGLMLGRHNYKVGPVWAIASSEVFNSWIHYNETIMPWSQAHGHTKCFSWEKNVWKSSASRIFRKNTKLNPELKISVTETTPNRLLVGADPGYDRIASDKKQPYLLLESI